MQPLLVHGASMKLAHFWHLPIPKDGVYFRCHLMRPGLKFARKQATSYFRDTISPPVIAHVFSEAGARLEGTAISHVSVTLVKMDIWFRKRLRVTSALEL